MNHSNDLPGPDAAKAATGLGASLSLDHNSRFLLRVYGKFLVPTILSVLGGTANTLVDSAIVGNMLGENALAAINLCMPIFLLCSAVGALLGSGGGLLSAALVGQGRELESCRAYTLATALELAFSLVVMVAGLALLEPIMGLLGADEALRPMAMDYARVAFLGAPVKCLLYIPYNYLRLDGKPEAVSLSLLVMTGCNGVLDVALIRMGWGMTGASLASVVGTVLGVAIGFAALRGGSFRFVSLRSGFPWWRELLALGVPPALNNLLDMARLILLNRILMDLGGGGLVAIFTVVCSMSDLTLCIVSGVPQTASPLMGVYWGEQNNPALRDLMKLQMVFGGVLSGVTAALTALLAGPICGLFGLSATQGALWALRLFALSLPLGMVCTAMVAFYNASGRVGLACGITVCRMFVCAVGPALLLARLGELAVWWFRPLSEGLTLLLLGAGLMLLHKKEKDLSPVLLLDERMDRDGKVIDFSVNNDPAAAAHAAQRIGGFCENNQLSPKLSMAISLTIEEMLTILFQHCFQPGEDSWVDLRVFVLPGKIGMRIRNGGKPFNPVVYYQEHQDKEEFEDMLGIQLVTKLASEIRYLRTFGVNTLNILFQEK